MKSLQTQLKTIRDILESTSAKGRVYHYTRPAKLPSSYVVWQEDGENRGAQSDNLKAFQQVHGTIDCFTKKEYDPLLDEIQEALNNAPHVGWALVSIQYEDDTTFIHYEWEFNVG